MTMMTMIMMMTMMMTTSAGDDDADYMVVVMVRTQIEKSSLEQTCTSTFVQKVIQIWSHTSLIQLILLKKWARHDI